jgi:hypothetical protein
VEAIARVVEPFVALATERGRRDPEVGGDTRQVAVAKLKVGR